MIDEIARERIARWIRDTMAEGKLDEFNDLHVDQISSQFRPKELWITASEHALDAARKLLGASGETLTLAIGISLTAFAAPVGLRATSSLDLVAELDWTPPSLYLFRHGAEPWLAVEGEECTELPRAFRTDAPEGKAFFCEWYHELDREFRRTVWLPSDR